VDTIRYHHDGIPAAMAPDTDTLPANPSKNQKRRHNLKAKLAEKNRTHFSLTNAHWQVTRGKLIKAMELQPAIDRLALHSSKVSTNTEYLNHLNARLATMETMKKYVKASTPSVRVRVLLERTTSRPQAEQGSFFWLRLCARKRHWTFCSRLW
jgi:hypothetical protein